MLLLPLTAIAQDNVEKNYYKYTIVSYTESMDNEDFTVKVDDGLTIEYLKGSEGKRVCDLRESYKPLSRCVRTGISG